MDASVLDWERRRMVVLSPVGRSVGTTGESGFCPRPAGLGPAAHLAWPHIALSGRLHVPGEPYDIHSKGQRTGKSRHNHRRRERTGALMRTPTV